MSMNQGKLEVVKQEMARVNINILGISELKWTGMGEFNSDDHYIYYCGQESLRRNGVISPLISGSILGTYRPGEFLFQYPIILPFHMVHLVLQARILKWSAIPFSSGQRCLLYHDPSFLSGPTQYGS